MIERACKEFVISNSIFVNIINISVNALSMKLTNSNKYLIISDLHAKHNCDKIYQLMPENSIRWSAVQNLFLHWVHELFWEQIF